MKKTIFLIVLLFILSVGNVEAKEVANKKNKYENPKTGVIDLKETIIPIALIGGCLIIHNIKSKK